MANDVNKKITDIKRQEEEEVAQKRAKNVNLPYLNLSTTPINPSAVEKIEQKTARSAGAVALRVGDSAINVGVKDPDTPNAKKLISSLKNDYKTVNVYVVSESSLQEAWSNYSSVEKGESKPLSSKMDIPISEVNKFKEQINSIKDINSVLKEISKTDATRALEVLFGAALSLDATDIHIEPREENMVVRLKIDGILHEVAQIDEHLYKLLISRTKLLSELKLNIHDSPQEGSFSLEYEDRGIEIRTSILPSQYGEDIALRILDSKFLLSLEELGLREDLFEILKHHLKEPQGLVLITGPTGSGKTTTLYACIKHIETSDIKIITLEDPIEYHLEGITQTEIGDNEKYTFKLALESTLRQDPDVILVSELRDLESVETSLQGALAGKKIFSTLHTLDAAGTAPRLTDMGASPKTIASALLASVAQRLVRRLCENCKQKTNLDKETADKFAEQLKTLPAEAGAPSPESIQHIYSPTKEGCEKCGETGYKGRIAIFEIMSATKKVKEKITKNPSEEEMREFAIGEGMTTMQQDAIIKILQGVTSKEEVERVLGELGEQD